AEGDPAGRGEVRFTSAGPARPQPGPAGGPANAQGPAQVVRRSSGAETAADPGGVDAHRPALAGDGVGAVLRLAAAEATEGAADPAGRRRRAGTTRRIPGGHGPGVRGAGQGVRRRRMAAAGRGRAGAGGVDEVHAVALLRCLKAEVDKVKVRKVFNQLLAVGKEALSMAWQGLVR